MKRLVSLFLVIAIVFMAYDAMAQVVVLKKYGKSMNIQYLQKGTRTWEYSTGLKVVGKGSKVYLVADTTGSGSTPVTSFTWTINGKPANSGAVLDSGASFPVFNSFTADSTGYYYVSVAVNGGATSGDTAYASTYFGVNRYDMFNAPNGCFCHGGGAVNAKFTAWQGSNHATIFYRGVTGQLEVDAVTNMGAYAKGCPQCHTTGYDVKLNNGNWAYLARYSYSGYDTTWYVGLPTSADGRDVMITAGDTTTVWKNMPAGLMKTANIGCENCHGPLGQHVASFGDKQYVAKSLAPDVCNACHDGSSKHSIGSYFRGSGHDLMPKSGEENSSSCAPCHYGGSFITWTETGKPWSGSGSSASFSASDVGTRITCAVCHDPHTMEFRTVTVDSLLNGYKLPASVGGKGQLCMNCHRGRGNYNNVVKPNSPPYYGFKSRFYPHHSNQADMFLGQNSYEFGDLKIKGVSTHTGLEDACVTCHMGDRNGLPNHFFSMDPSEPNYTLLGGARNYNPVNNCKPCHGEITTYDDIKAMYDYDGDGVVEGVESEVAGLMATLESRLPKDSTGTVIGEGTVSAADSAAIMNKPDLVAGIWTYWYVYMDGSGGMHNAKYTIALLQKALGIYPLSVERADLGTPDSYALLQNYPNPFNPSTTISFALPKSGHARVDVYDVLGKHVTTLIDENMGSGNFRVTWDGSDKNGARVASGMYIYRMVSGSFSMTKKMLMVK